MSFPSGIVDLGWSQQLADQEGQVE